MMLSSGFLSSLDGELRASVAGPLHSLGTLLVAAGDDVHLVAHHERRVEAQSEVAYYGIGIVLVFVEEVVDAREGNLVDILVYLLLGHSDASVADGQRAGILVQAYSYRQVAQLSGEVAFLGEGLQLLRSIRSVRHHLAEEYLVIRIQELFNYGEDVLCSNPDVALCHVFIFVLSSTICQQCCK